MNIVKNKTFYTLRLKNNGDCTAYSIVIKSGNIYIDVYATANVAIWVYVVIMRFSFVFRVMLVRLRATLAVAALAWFTVTNAQVCNAANGIKLL